MNEKLMNFVSEDECRRNTFETSDFHIRDTTFKIMSTIII